MRPLNNAEGRRIAAALLTAAPETSLRELARRSGLSTATARDVRDRLRRGQDPVPERQRQVVRPASRRPDTPPRVPGRPALRKLAQDPSLTATEPGRLLLRALFTTELTPDQWQRIVAALPEHRVPLVRTLAARRAAEWNALADALARPAKNAAA
ncbi:hypothetical protein [Streptomyces sp. NEAU-S77]|uniref:hypothetical protein n=1 Tax=Streptomyces sp. NEAU-S77 TaxID=3411033 RepID=UPI003BA2B2F0